MAVSKNKRKNGTVGQMKPPTNPAPQKSSVASRSRDAAAQIAALISDFQTLVKGVQAGFEEVNVEVNKLRVILGAAIAVAGTKEQVEAKIKMDKMEAQKKAIDDAQANLQKLIDQGIAVHAPKISEGSLIVGYENDAEGNTLFPGRIQIQVEAQTMRDELRAQLIGQGIGASVKPDQNKTMFVTEIYDIDPERLAAVQAEQTAAAEAAKQQAQVQPAANGNQSVVEAPFVPPEAAIAQAVEASVQAT